MNRTRIPETAPPSRKGLSQAEARRLEGTQFAAECAVYMQYRAGEEPSSARGKAAAAAKEDLYAVTMARNPKIGRRGMEAEAAKGAGLVRSRLLSGELTVEAFDRAFALCDQEFRLGVVRAWGVLTDREPLKGPDQYDTRYFAEICGGMYRHVAAEYRSAPGNIAEAARAVEEPVAREYARRTRRPYPEAVGLLRERERGTTRAAKERRLKSDDVRFTLELCDEKLGLSVARHAQLRPVYRPNPAPTPALRQACDALPIRANAQARTARIELDALGDNASNFLRGRTAGRICGVYTDAHRLSMQMGCEQALVDAMTQMRDRAVQTLAPFNEGQKAQWRCEQSQ